MLNVQIAKLFGTVELDDRNFTSKMADIEKRLENLRKGIPTIKVRLDLGKTLSELKNIIQTLRNINKTFSAKIDIGNLNTANREFERMRRHSQQIRRNMRGINRNQLQLGALASGGFQSFATGAATGLGLQFALNPAMAAGQLFGRGALGSARSSINTQFRRVNIGRIGEFDAEQNERLRSGLFGVGREIGVSQEQIFGIAEGAARQNINDPDDLVRFTRSAASVSRIIDDIPADELATSLSRLLEKFGGTVENVDGLGSAIARLDETSKASASGIVNVATRLSGTASSLGLTLPQTLAISTSALEGGVRAEMGSTAILRILVRLFSDPASFAQPLGVDPQDFASNLAQDPLSAFEQIRGAIDEAGESGEAAKFIKEDLDFKNVRDFQTILNSVIDRLREFSESAAEEIKTKDALRRAESLFSETAQDQIQKLQNAFVELGDTIGESGVLAFMSEFTGNVTELAKAFNDAINSGGFQGLSDVFKFLGFGGDPDQTPEEAARLAKDFSLLSSAGGIAGVTGGGGGALLGGTRGSISGIAAARQAGTGLGRQAFKLSGIGTVILGTLSGVSDILSLSQARRTLERAGEATSEKTQEVALKNLLAVAQRNQDRGVQSSPQLLDEIKKLSGELPPGLRLNNPNAKAPDIKEEFVPKGSFLGGGLGGVTASIVGQALGEIAGDFQFEGFINGIINASRPFQSQITDPSSFRDQLQTDILSDKTGIERQIEVLEQIRDAIKDSDESIGLSIARLGLSGIF